MNPQTSQNLYPEEIKKDYQNKYGNTKNKQKENYLPRHYSSINEDDESLTNPLTSTREPKHDDEE